MKDNIGKSIIVAVLLFAATAAMAMDPKDFMMFWGGGSGVPISVTFGGDADVTFGGDTVTFGVE